MSKAKKSSGFNTPLLPSLLLRALFFFVPIVLFKGTHDPFFVKETLAQIILVTLAIFWAGNALTRSRFNFRTYPLLIPLLCYGAAQLLSLKNAVHPALVIQSFAWQTLLLGLYVSCVEFANAPVKNKIESALLWASLIMGAYGILQHFGIAAFAGNSPWNQRPSSTFGNPNFAAGWWIMVLPLFGSRLIEKVGNRWLTITVLVVGVLNLAWGQTAGAWAAELSAIGIVCGIWGFKKHLSLGRMISLPFFLILGLAVFAAAFKLSAQRWPEHQSIQERILKWRTAGQMMRDYPIFGVGAGNVKVHFALYRADVSRQMKRSLIGTSESNVHNEYLQVASETGAVGLIAFLSIFAVWIYRRAKSDEPTPKSFGYLAAALAFLFYSLTNFPYRITPNACLLIFILAASENKNEDSENFAIAPSSANYFGTAIVFAVIFWKWIWPPFYSEILHAKAQDLMIRKNFGAAAELYEKAIALDFYRSERTAYELGECRRAAGEMNKAIDAYKISTSLRNYGEVYNNIGNCYYLLGQFSDAKTNWQKAAGLELPDPGAQLQTIENIKAVQRLYPGEI